MSDRKIRRPYGTATNKQELFNVILNRVSDVGMKTGLKKPQAFARWFAEMYYLEPQGIFVSDGSHDGKVDLFSIQIMAKL